MPDLFEMLLRNFPKGDGLANQSVALLPLIAALRKSIDGMIVAAGLESAPE